jgi:hypothetical protein
MLDTAKYYGVIAPLLSRLWRMGLFVLSLPRKAWASAAWMLRARQHVEKLPIFFTFSGLNLSSADRYILIVFRLLSYRVMK